VGEFFPRSYDIFGYIFTYKYFKLSAALNK